VRIPRRLGRRIGRVTGANRNAVARALAAVGVFGVVVGGLLNLAPAPATAAINNAINFQGKMVNTDGTNITNGTYNVQFKIYTGGDGCVPGGSASSPCGGTLVWTESWLNNNSQGVNITDGLFQLDLGSITSLPNVFNTNNVWLSVNLGDTSSAATFAGAGGDGEMLPFIHFTAAPYAINSDMLGGLHASDFAQLSPGSAQSGFLNVTGNITSGATVSGTTVAASTSLQAPLVDTATAAALNIGTGTATSVTIGRTSTPFLIQGNSSSTFTSTSGSNKTTVAFATPTANTTLNIPASAAGTYTICTSDPTTCGSTYATGTSGSFLAKNGSDISSFAVTASNYLYGFTNSSSAVASGVLQLDNGSNTGNALYVTASGNPGSGSALIVANDTNGTPSGNLLDLQHSAASEFAVDYNGNVTQNGGSSTSRTINGQTISSAANFTGTVTAATSVLAPLVDTASAGVLSVGTTNATQINLNQNAQVAAGKNLTFASGAGNFDQSASTGTLKSGTGNVSLNGNTTVASNKSFAADGSALFQDATNSASAFQIQNSAGSAILVGDTTDTNLIQNPGGEVASGFTTAWPAAGFGSNAAVSQDATTAWNGSAAVKVVVNPSVANAGAVNNLGVALATGTQYTLSFYAKLKSGDPAFSDITAQYLRDGSTTDANCGSYNTQTVLSGGWTRVTCTFTTSGTAGNTNAAIAIYQASAPGASRTWLLDGVQLEQTSNVVNAYGAGNLRVDAVVTSPVAVQNLENSTTALQVVNAAGTTLLNADTLNSKVSVNGTLQTNTITPTGALTIGATGQGFTLQGSASSTITATNGGNTTTISFTAPTTARSVIFPDEGGTVCFQSSTNCGFAVGSGTAFLQGGNSFGAAGDLGTNDGNALNIRTNGTTKLSVSTGGDLTFAGGGVNGNFDQSASTGTFKTATGNVSLNGNTTVASNKSFTANGSSLLQNGTDSTTGFQLLASGGANLLTGDTLNTMLTSSANFETIGYYDNGIGGIGLFGNLLQRSEQFDNAAWTKNLAGTAATADQVAAPDGQATADKIHATTNGGNITQSTSAGNNTYTFSVWLKTGSSTQNVDLRIDSNGTPGTGTVKTVAATTTWQRFFVTQAFTSGVTSVTPTIFPGGTAGTDAVNVYAWGGQLVQASNPEVYVRTTGAVVAANAGVVSNGGEFISSANAGDVPLVIQGDPSQTGDLVQAQNSGGTPLFKVSSAGAITGVGVNSGTGLIQGTGGETITGTEQLNATGSGTTTIGSSSAGAVSLASGAASSFTVTGANLTVSTATSGTLAISSAGALNLTGAANSSINVGSNSLAITASNLSVTTGGVLNLVGGAAGLQIGGAAATGHYLRGNGTSYVDSTIQASDGTGAFVKDVPTATSDNTIAPATNSVVALTVKGTTGTAADVIDIYNSAGTPALQDYFDSAGSLNVGQLIQPTSGNSIDLGKSGTTFRTGYFGTSVVAPSFTGAGAVGVSSGAASALTITSNAASTWSTSTGNLTVDAGAALNLGTSSATSLSIGKSTTTATVNGALALGASAGSGALLNNGATTNTELAKGDFATGGSIGSAATTVDIYTYISVAQTTTGQSLTIPTPTASTTYGKLLYLSNIGTASFTLLGSTLAPGSTATLVWANKNGGAAWTYAGADGSSILNQNAAVQSANFLINGTGEADTALLTPLLDSPAGTTTLNIGTNNATAGIVLNQDTSLSAGKNFSTASGTGTITQNYSNNTGTGTTLNATNTGASGAHNVHALDVNLTGTNTTGTNNNTGISFGNVTNPGGTNNFYGLNFGTGLTDLLRYNNTQLISGTGLLQNAAIDSTLTYSNLQKVGALSAGSIASGFGTISTGNNITTTATIQGGTINATTVFQANGTPGVAVTCATGDSLTGATFSEGIITAGTCTTIGGGGTFLAKNATDTSSAAAGTGYLYTFTNSSSAAAGGVLSLDNGNNTGNALNVTAAGSLGSGKAMIEASNTLNNATGNLLDLRSTQATVSASRFSVDMSGNATAASSLLTPLLDTPSGTTTLDVGTNNATAGVVLHQSTLLSGGKNLTFSSGAGNFDQSSSTGTFDTGTGNVTLRGNTTVSNNKSFTAGGSAKFQDATDSTTGFQVLNSGGTNLLTADGVNSLLSSSANFESIGYYDNGVGGIGQFGNMLQRSEQIDTVWSAASNGSVTANTVAAPDGQTTADTVHATASGGKITQGVSAGNNTYTFSVWLKTAASTQSVDLRIDSNGTPGTGTVKTVTATTTWQRYFVTQTFTSGVSTATVAIFPGTTGGTDSQTVYAWGGQLVQASNSEVYVRTTGAAVAASAGVVSNGGIFASSANAGDIPVIVQGDPSQTGDLIQAQNSGGTPLFKVSSAGALTSVGVNSGSGLIQGTGGVTVTGTAQINATGAATTTIGSASAGAVAVASGAASSFSVTGANLTLSTVTTGTLAVTSAAALNLTGNGASTWDIGNNTLSLQTTNNGAITTGTGAISLNGNTTVANGKTLNLGSTAGNGALVNNGTTTNSERALSNFGSNANISTADVDAYTYISINQTTGSITIGVNSPTASTTYGKLLYVSNIGNQAFTMLGTTISAGTTATLVWANKNGGAGWTFAGADGSSILNQSSSAQTANFYINGSGRADTSILTPLLDSTASVNTLDVGTTNATGGINIHQNTLFTANKGITFSAGSGSFDQSSATTGTFKTGGGAVSLNGATTVTGANTFTVNSGASSLNGNVTVGTVAGTTLFKNNGASQNVACAYSISGSITLNTAGKTVNDCTAFAITVTSGSPTITVPSPTAGDGSVIYITNVATSTSGITILSTSINAGATATLVYNGSAWTFAGQDANGLQAAYNNSGTTNPQIALSTTNGGVKIDDASSGGVSGALFSVNNNGHTVSYLSVTSAAATITGDINFTKEADRTIKVNDSTTSNTVGGKLTLQSAAGTGTANGGDLNVTAGTGGSTSGVGGNINITAGAAGGGNTNGGAVTITSGASAGTGTSGTLTVQSAAGASFSSGSTNGGIGGVMFIQGGNGGSSTGTGTGNGGNASDIQITAGNGGSATSGHTNGNGGNIRLTAGNAGGGGGSAGSPGVVFIDSPVFTSTTESTSASPFAVPQSDVDNFGTVVVTDTSAATIPSVTVPSPSNNATGHVLYIVAGAGSNSFTLTPSGGPSVYMSAGTTSQLVWNGASWTGSSADSSLQAVYNDTQVSPASIVTTSATKNILFQAGSGFDNANLFQIGNSSGAQILTVDTTNTATTSASGVGNIAVNGGAESAFGSEWAGVAGSGTVTPVRDTTSGEFLSGAASVKVPITSGNGANSGVKNVIGTALVASTSYNITFAIKASSWSAVTNSNITVKFSPDGTSSNNVTCSTFQASSNPAVNTTSFIKWDCNLTTGSTTTTSSAFISILQGDAVTRNLFIDNFSVAPVTTGAQDTSDLQVGGPNSQGLTLLTLDNYSSAPFSGSTNTNLLGSMYYDTTFGRIQCYEADGWGACGASPTQTITLAPEYPGAVLNSSLNANNNGTMTANLCANSGDLSGGTVIQPDASLCGSGQIFNFYKWTTTQSTAQLFDIFDRYTLPPTFKAFSGNITITARTSSTTNGVVTGYLYAKNGGGTDGTLCNTGGTDLTTSGGANTWSTVTIPTTNCTFSAGDTIMFRVSMSSKSSALVYASNIIFTFTGK
jgi:hypothetical protein